eukprot:1608344-Prymnesium_polylepis.1
MPSLGAPAVSTLQQCALCDLKKTSGKGYTSENVIVQPKPDPSYSVHKMCAPHLTRCFASNI